MAAAKPTPSAPPQPRLDLLLSTRAQRRARLLVELRLLDLRRARLTCAEAVLRRRLETGEPVDVTRACDYSQLPKGT